MTDTPPLNPTDRAPSTAATDAAKLAGGSSVVFGAQLVDRGARFGAQWLLARFLGETAFGIYTSATTIAFVASSITQFGTHTGAVYFGARHRTAGDQAGLKGLVRAGLVVNGAAGAVVAVVLALAAWLQPGWFKSPEIAMGVIIAAPTAFLRPLQRFMAALLQSAKDMRGTSRSTYVTLPVSLVVTVAVALALGLGVPGAAAAFTASFGFALLDATVRGWSMFGRPQLQRDLPSAPMAGALLRYSLPMSFADVLYRLNLWMDILILTALVASAEVGQYKVAVSLASIGLLPTTAVRTMFRPMVAEMERNGEIERLNDILETATRWITIAAAPLFIVVFLVPDGLLMVFGKEYAAGAGALTILMLGQIVNVTCAPTSTVLTMGGYTRLEMGNAIAAVTLNIVLNVLLIPRIGFVGAAVASAAALTLWSLLPVLAPPRWHLRGRQRHLARGLVGVRRCLSVDPRAGHRRRHRGVHPLGRAGRHVRRRRGHVARNSQPARSQAATATQPVSGRLRR
jgi:O-antigen/teichoic acid export membrane protein